MQKKYIFLDRDGVINEDLFNYVTSPKEFKFIKGSLEAIIALSNAGYQIIVVTNQACIGTGIATINQINQVNEFMTQKVVKNGGRIDKVFVCPHRQDAGCKCRKPEIGLMVQAEKELQQSLRGIYFIGDKESDIQAALNYGCVPLLVLTGYGSSAAKEGSLSKNIKTFSNLKAAVEYVLDND